MSLDPVTITLLVQVLIELIKMAEKAFNKEKSGPEKKAAVENGMNSIFNSVAVGSTGKQKENLEAVRPLVSPAIDIFASQLFPKEER